jgi:YHS domain-containing protein
MHHCITCDMRMNSNKAHLTIRYEGHRYLVCCPLCQAEFEKDPSKYIHRALWRHEKKGDPRRSRSTAAG